MNYPALAQLFYRELEKIAAQTDVSGPARAEQLYRLLTQLFIALTQEERLQFSTLFSRIAYVSHRSELPRALQYHIHRFRRQAMDRAKGKEVDAGELVQLGLKVLAEATAGLLREPIPSALQASLPSDWPGPMQEREVAAFRDKVRVVAVADDAEQRQLVVREETLPGKSLRVQYNEADRNDSFRPTIEAIRSVIGFPVALNLLDVEVDQQGVYHPLAFVVEPDYLMDVTAVAECFRSDGESPWPFLLKKYLPKPPNKYLMIGNIANFFLDELIANPAVTFQEAFRRTFQLSPLDFCLLDNREVREIMQRSQKHFVNLKQMVAQGFEEQGITPSDCYLEPSFYSETYGLQGRLDLLHQSGSKAAIVELKSGKPFRPNVYGLSVNHFTQTLLYDLLVRSAFGRGTNPQNYILYSGVEDKQLRYAPRIKSQQYEALQVRNQLVAIERLLASLGHSKAGDILVQGQRLFGRLSPQSFPGMKGFLQRDLQAFAEVYQKAPPLMRRYFSAFSGFIAREQQLAKTGVPQVDRVNGLSALWQSDFEQKQSDYEIISHLELDRNEAAQDNPLLHFRKTEHTNPLANFREGDIAVLYPHQEGGQPVLSNQIFKCTIVRMEEELVVLRLRSRQLNGQLFDEYPYWNLEHDMLDSGFNAMYRGLYAFLASPSERQDLLLAKAPPSQVPPLVAPVPAELTKEQQRIFRQVIAAEDYFLLWGPPGTGKTSMMLKHLVGYWLEHTDEQLLLLAYTNRAVDEICEAIEQVREDMRRHYFRVGSRYSTAEHFRSQLLSVKTEKAQTRRELKEIIHRHRIVVATVASVAGKSSLLQLKQFDRVIIDEASQILEPMLVGLLSQFKRFVLIGDHKQLPAVVVQRPEESVVDDADLQAIGLHNLRNSLFERLFKQCIANNWHWAYAQLSHQGRMHRHVMDFPNRYFYNGTLQILPAEISAHLTQLAEPPFLLPIGQSVVASRVAFLDMPVDTGSLTQKTNEHEAVSVAKLVQAIAKCYAGQGRELSAKSIGVITPYRAQIAQIRAALTAWEVAQEWLTIDTVERYQGGAREVIIISLCTNGANQLESLASLSDEGVDRKLNVALTRAREYVILLGNRGILEQNEIYRALIRHCQDTGAFDTEVREGEPD